MNRGWLCGAWLVVAIGCSEASDTDGTGSGSTASGGNGGSSSNGGAGNASATGGAGNDGQGGSGNESSQGGMGNVPGNIDAIVINEISGAGDDYVELFNTSSEEVDLSGLKIADDDDGSPKVDGAVVIPAGTTLGGGDYLFLLADLEDAAMEGFSEDCDVGPSPCLHASWGISKDNGDRIYLLDSGDGELKSAEYPPAATEDGETWSRLPNGTGAFAVGAPTPGEANTEL